MIKKNVLLSGFSSYKIGGPAKYFAEIGNEKDLIGVFKNPEVAKLSHLPGGKGVVVLGGGTNVLIDDKGYDGLVILNKIKHIKRDGSDVIAGSGVQIEDLLNFCIENSLSGLEWAGGLPGTLGGAVRGNAGAFGGEMKDVVVKVTSLRFDFKPTSELARSDLVSRNPATSQVGREIRIRNKDECSFGYRNSVFKSQVSDEIITEVVLNLKKGDREAIRKQIEEKINYRKERHPSLVNEPNAGSTFKNIPIENLPKAVVEEFKDKIKTDPFPVLPVVKLIAGAGMTGQRAGNIVVSPIHPNYLVNIGKGTSRDVLSLIDRIKKAVKEKYGVELEEEITLV
ncbi:MAG: FAD-binding protein [Patescibacteria group bacterium]